MPRAGPQRSQARSLRPKARTGHAARPGPPVAGVSAVLGQKKDKAMVKGQGRWGLYVKRPSAMIEYYRQASLEEKLNTTDLAAITRTTRSKTD